MNDIKPTIFLEIWRSPVWRICWAIRSFNTVRQFNQWYEYTEHFYGRTATIHCGTSDFDMSREELLEVAIKHVQGNCVTFHYDLKNLTVTTKQGNGSTPDY